MPEDASKPEPGKKKHGLPRRLFRWFRIACLLGVLALVIAVIWLNQVGLPDFLKKPLLAELRTRGIELQFDRIRLRWYHGIVAEKVTIGRSAQAGSPQLSASEVTVRVNGQALSQRRFQVDGLVLRDGKLTVPLLVSNEPPYQVVVDNIQSELLLLPGDKWELADLQGQALGCTFTASGTLTNASQLPALVRTSTPPSAPGAPPRPSSPRTLQTLRQIAREIEAIQFASPPALSLQLRADAANTNDFLVNLTLSAANARTRWGTVRDLRLDVPIRPVPGTNGLAQTHVTLQFTRLNSPQVQAGRTKLDLHATQSVTNPLPSQVDLHLSSRLVKSEHAEAGEIELHAFSQPISNASSNHWQSRLSLELKQFITKPAEAISLTGKADLVHTLTNFSLLTTKANLRADGLKTKWGDSQQAFLVSNWTVFTNRFQPAESQLTLKLETPKTQWGSADQIEISGQFGWNKQTPLPGDAQALSGWTNAWPFNVTASLNVTNLQSPQLHLSNAAFKLDWHPPLLQVANFQSQLYEGGMALDASLNALTRKTSIKGGANFDIHQILHFFHTNTQKWIRQHEFVWPPELVFNASATLPAWTNRAPDWQGEVLPTLLLDGGVRVGEGKFRTVPYLSGHTCVRMAGTKLDLPDLQIQRPEGAGRAEYRSDVVTRNYYWKLDSTVDPKAILPFLETAAQKKVLNEFEFTSPPGIRGEIWGRWGAPELTGGHVDLALTNFVYRGGAFSNVTLSAEYTNLIARVTNITVRSGTQTILADGVLADIKGERLWFTNVNSTYDPYAFTRIIGTNTAKAIEPYQFAQPPTVRMNGSMHFNNERLTDLHFDISGGPFHYWKLNFERLAGQVHWVTNTLTITNVQGRGYDGNVLWSGFFDFAPPKRSDFSFQSDFIDFDLQPLLRDLQSRSNSTTGRLTGTLNITSARSDDTNSWQGFGHMQMQDGHLWDIPMVGMLSGPLNAVIPGLGKTRVKEGEGDYTITDSVVHTRNLELKAPTMRLQYKGSVDLGGAVDATVEVELLRDAWVVGRIFSLAMAPITKALAYKVTGTLNSPKSEPLYILPKFLMLPLQPFKLLKDLVTDDKEKKPEPDKQP